MIFFRKTRVKIFNYRKFYFLEAVSLDNMSERAMYFILHSRLALSASIVQSLIQIVLTGKLN